MVAPLPQLQNGHQHAKGHGQYGGEYDPVVDRKQKADRIDWNPEQRDGAEEGEIHQFAPVHGIYSLTNRVAGGGHESGDDERADEFSRVYHGPLASDPPPSIAA